MKLMYPLAAAIAVCAMSSASLAQMPPSKIALNGARIIPIVGDEIAEGTIVIERGKITAIGQMGEVDIPFDAMEVDLEGMVVMPGFIHACSSSGLDRSNESLPVTPYLDVYDATDPSSLFFEQALRSGITAVHVMQGPNTVIGGVSRLVRPIGLSMDEMSIRGDLAMVISTSPRGGFDRMAQIATLREAFFDLDAAIDALAEKRYEEEQAKDDKDVNVSPAEARDLGKELIRDEDYNDGVYNLVRLRRGELSPWVYAGAAMDVAPAIEIMDSQDVLDQTVFILSGDSFKAAPQIAATGRPVVIGPDLTYRERDPMSGKLDETFLPKMFYDAGVMFAMLPNESGAFAERYPTFNAAQCVRNGIPRQTALEAITINPAKILGVDEAFGSIEVGKTANLVVLSGDPLDFNSWVEQSYIDGILAYDREKDSRLRELLESGEMGEEAPADEQADAAATDESAPADAPAGDSGGAGDGSGDGAGDGSGDGSGSGEGR
ncbi:MAG: amidohydrolase family protein [Phycisphaerales bacterium JB065]